MPSYASPPRQRADVSKDLDEIRQLLRLVAIGGIATREVAVDYLHYRSSLLASAISDMLPGFLYQCVTIDRFKDFVHLYDPDVDLRCEFIDRMIDRARAFNDREPDLQETKPPSRQSPSWDF